MIVLVEKVGALVGHRCITFCTSASPSWRTRGFTRWPSSAPSPKQYSRGRAGCGGTKGAGQPWARTYTAMRTRGWAKHIALDMPCAFATA